VYVLGGVGENELLLLSALNVIFESISLILKKNLDRKTIMDCMDRVLLAVDEICDEGVLLELDPENVVSRVGVRTDDVSIGDQTVAHVQAKIEAKMLAGSSYLQSAREQLKWSILK